MLRSAIKLTVLFMCILWIPSSCSDIPSGSPKRGPARDKRVESTESVSLPTDEQGLLSTAEVLSSRYHVRRNKYVVLIDYTRPLMQERLYLVNLQSRHVVLRSRVSHAWASGILRPTAFSNVPETKQSCPGAFETLGSYQGSFGYSMRLKGLDKGVNDNAYKRAIVFHSTAQMKGPYTYGCFATSEEVNHALIDSVKGGSLVFVHR